MKGYDGNLVEVTSIEKIEEEMHVVSIDVEDFDNYFAGETPVIIHNIDFGKF